ncbi:MAG: lipoprotein-releasing ABC transporter permease subunit [Holosporales bacterium]|jgi:lipoprotein-releasing system permease protein|nr:lipoprotein-releasing ABC transporter permease subunit [Holosporales bacterium]
MLFSATERFLAWRYIRAKRRERFISVVSGFAYLGIALGVATLIIVTAVMNGFRIEFMDRIVGFNGHLAIQAPYGIQEYTEMCQKIISCPGVTYITPLIQRQAMVTVSHQILGILVQGIEPKDLAQKDPIQKGLISGDLASFGQEEDGLACGCILGSKLAKRLHVTVGNTVTIIMPEFSETGFGVIPRSKTLRVQAIFEVGMRDYDGHIIFIPLSLAQRMFHTAGCVDTLEVVVKDPLRIAQITEDVRDYLDPLMEIVDWQHLNKTFMGAVEVQRNVLFLILSLMVLVASFNIISSMVMLVRDKTKDIAILRTLGATQGSVLRIFLMIGSFIGMLGTFSGFAFGLVFTLNIESIRKFLEGILKTNLFPDEVYFLSTLPAKVEPFDVTVTIITALLFSFLATLYPAWKASRCDPVEVLRYE